MKKTVVVLIYCHGPIPEFVKTTNIKQTPSPKYYFVLLIFDVNYCVWVYVCLYVCVCVYVGVCVCGCVFV